MQYLLTEKRDAVLYITFNRPDKFNSFIREMALECQQMLREADRDEEIRCVVLRGSGKAFCAGQDLQEATDPNGPPLSEIVSQHYNPIILLIRNLSKPVIALSMESLQVPVPILPLPVTSLFVLLQPRLSRLLVKLD